MDQKKFIYTYLSITVLIYVIGIIITGDLNTLGGFLFYEHDRFHDFYGVINHYEKFTYSEYLNYPINYFPNTFWMVKLFIFLNITDNLIFSFLSIILTFLFYRFTNCKKEYFLLILSFPFLIWFDRGNFEILIALLIAWAYAILQSNFKYKQHLFISLILIAFSIKIFPIIFLIILPFNLSTLKKITLLTIVLVLIPFGLFFLINHEIYPDINEFLMFKNAFNSFTHQYYIKDGSLGWSHSIFNFIKATIYSLDKIYPITNIDIVLNNLLKINYLFGSVFGLIIFIIRKRLSNHHLFLLLVLYYIVIPPSGGAYTLLLLVLSLQYYFKSQRITITESIYLILVLIPMSNTFNGYTTVLSVFKSIPILLLIFKIFKSSRISAQMFNRQIKQIRQIAGTNER